MRVPDPTSAGWPRRRSQSLQKKPDRGLSKQLSCNVKYRQVPGEWLRLGTSPTRRRFSGCLPCSIIAMRPAAAIPTRKSSCRRRFHPITRKQIGTAFSLPMLYTYVSQGAATNGSRRTNHCDDGRLRVARQARGEDARVGDTQTLDTPDPELLVEDAEGVAGARDRKRRRHVVYLSGDRSAQ
jgi:hypothetical protein